MPALQVMADSTSGPVPTETGSDPKGLPPNADAHLTDIHTHSWGFALDALYRMATAFFKEHEGKAFHISYEDKLSLVAYTLQVTHGPFNGAKCGPLGYLDVIGRDRRQAWTALGDVDRKTAMEKFIELLNLRCPLFRPFVEAHKADMEEKERKRLEEEEERRKEEEEERERQRLEEELARQEQERLHQLEQKRLIQEALNRQTYHQFKAYAEQQFPASPDQQGVLIRQLQEQHYHQYMQQVLGQQKGKTTEPTAAAMDEGEGTPVGPPEEKEPTPNGDRAHSSGEEDDEESTEEDAQELPAVATASMWTRKDIREFKEGIRKEGSNGILKVGHGETVTVRVPTHSNGHCLFWEFATDSYDLGFGLYFEWTSEPGNQMSVHVSESDEDEDEDEGVPPAPSESAEVMGTPSTARGEGVLDDYNDKKEREGGGDVEKGASAGDGAGGPASLSVVIPVYRRDCHEEVYAGSHLYPGQGVYLLKFDNSYSLWRSKTLYYRVYYTR